MRAALATLPPREREVIALKFHAGLDNAELAAVLGVSVSNAGTLLHRAMTKLREAVDDRCLTPCRPSSRSSGELLARGPAAPRRRAGPASLDARAAAGFPRPPRALDAAGGCSRAPVAARRRRRAA